MNKHNKIITFTFTAFLILMLGFNITKADSQFSENENRMLKQQPKLSINNIFSGEFTKQYEEYITDQFIFRNFWVGAKSNTDVIMMKKDIKDVYFGKNGYLLQKFSKPDKAILDRNMEGINKLTTSNKGIQVYLMVTPLSSGVLKDKLPPFAASYDQMEVIKYGQSKIDKSVKFIDVNKTLESKKDEYIYYKTDHHWTTKGAYYAYREFCNNVGLKPYDTEHFNIERVTENFYGTLQSKVNYNRLKPDYIETYTPKTKLEYDVQYMDTQTSSSSLYEMKHLNSKDKYSVFLDGNHALVKIKTNIENNKKILILKDSYAHSFVPFLTEHYSEIHMIDLRYFNMSTNEYIKQFYIDEVLMLYNISSFSEENTLAKLKR